MIEGSSGRDELTVVRIAGEVCDNDDVLNEMIVVISSCVLLVVDLLGGNVDAETYVCVSEVRLFTTDAAGRIE